MIGTERRHQYALSLFVTLNSFSYTLLYPPPFEKYLGSLNQNLFLLFSPCFLVSFGITLIQNSHLL